MSHQTLVAACNELEVTVQRYGEEVEAAAIAEADYKSARARRVLRARADGARSVAEAETIADADDVIADLLMRRLTTAAITDASKQRIVSLRERIGAQRSYLVDQRAADQLHAQSGVRT